MSDISNSRFVVNPIEKHIFVQSKDEFLCELCNKPRALHQFTDFVPAPDKLRGDVYAQQRFGRHPYFYQPGKLRNEIEREERLRANGGLK